jgi:hypothetical protein
MDTDVEDRIVVESERSCSVRSDGRHRRSPGPGSAALPRPMGRRAHEHLRSVGRRREDRAAQERAPDRVTDGRPRGATTSAPPTAPALRRPESPLRATSRATASSAFSPSS